MAETRRQFAKARFTVALDTREAFNAALRDVAMFGTGAVLIDGKGNARHVALESLQAFADATNKMEVTP